MNFEDLKRKLHDNGVNLIDGKGTEPKTYSLRSDRASLWSGANRLNSAWIRAELIIVNDAKAESKSDAECIEQWKTMNIKPGQMLLLKTDVDTWNLYDKDGRLIGDESFFIKKYETPDGDIPEQVIYFGAPGTGKSHTINEMIKKKMAEERPDVASLTPGQRVELFDNYLRSHGYRVNDNGKLSNEYPKVLTRADDAEIASMAIGKRYAAICEISSSEEIQKVIDFLENDPTGIEHNTKRSNKAPSDALKQYKNLLSKDFSGNIFRVTFHPESDYASFVGCFKPSMENDKIVYSYTTQAFTDAYIYAWTNKNIPTYLIIEEINRGNCAAIFGDLFQLLDRKNGISEYPIRADKDLADYLAKCLSDKGADGIKEGMLCLPANLHIIATMNTSDQGLFPMDSAFKRRWEWEYVPIMKGNETYTIITSPAFQKDWWDFIREVNKRIEAVTLSSDKKIGFWFVKPVDGIISTEYFVSKVVSYLWNDVFKNVDKKNKENVFLFAEGEDPIPHTFDSFFDDTTGKINTSMVERFILGIMKDQIKLSSSSDETGTDDNE